MFQKQPNYFYKTKPAKKYEPVQKTWEWQTEPIPENTPQIYLKHLKEVKNYVAVEHNFQQEINTQIFYTPEQIQKFNIKLDTSGLQYQKADLKNFNATDLRNAAKEMTNDAIKQKAQSETDKQIQQLQKQINNLKNQQKNKQIKKPEENKENK